MLHKKKLKSLYSQKKKKCIYYTSYIFHSTYIISWEIMSNINNIKIINIPPVTIINYKYLLWKFNNLLLTRYFLKMWDIHEITQFY